MLATILVLGKRRSRARSCAGCVPDERIAWCRGSALRGGHRRRGRPDARASQGPGPRRGEGLRLHRAQRHHSPSRLGPATGSNTVARRLRSLRRVL